MEDDKINLSVRKGAWTEEEDELLRRCIEKFGEGKWHQVPFKAGLNRCRKSCRLRWLNYLKPTIKRGEFGDDEIDLIIRLHRLLGNRWSLIAGRLPGRTANDIKNYWNSLLRKKVAAPVHPHNSKHKNNKKVNVIKPRPWSFNKKLSTGPVENINLYKAAAPPPPPPPSVAANEKLWWENLLEERELNEEQGQLLISDSNAISEEKEILSGSSDTWAEVATPLIIGEQLSSWTDFVMDMDLWDWDHSLNYNNLNSEKPTLG